MESVARFSAWVILAGVVCFAPCAVGQGSARNSLARSASGILGRAPATFLTLAFSPSSDHGGGDRGGSGGGGCSNQNAGQNAGRDNGARGGGDGCTAVPEGGPAVTYLLLSGVFCLGAMLWRFRRQAGVHEAK
jgi:hypothetical protein